MSSSPFPIPPPIEPMLAKLAEAIPDGDGYLYEPKWDGFRAIVFRAGAELFIQSRDLRPLDRYFPELHEARRDRHRHVRRSRLRCVAVAAAPGGEPRRHAGEADALRLRRLRSARGRR
jgi:hypothetical protein